jgi:outer membrane protein TolC
MTLLSIAGTTAGAEQSEPAAPSRQADQMPASDTKSTPMSTQASAQNNGANAPVQQTPAQRKYGLPRNPLVGELVDTDLSKPLTLERAIRIGLQMQNAIAIAQTQAQAANSRLIQSLSNYYPFIAPTSSYTNNVQPGTTIGINGRQVSGVFTTETYTNSISGRFNIFDTGVREANVGFSRRNLYASEYSVGNTRQDVVLNVTTGYYNVRLNGELVRVQEESVRRSQTSLDVIRAQVEAKLAAQSDTLQAEADLANAQFTLLQAQNNYNLSQASLKNAMGVATTQPLILTNEPLPTPPPDPDPNASAYYVRLAFQNRFDIKQQQENVNAQGYNVKIAQINNGITLDANITEGYAFTPNEGEERQFAVTLTYPLFDAGNTRAIVNENKALMEQQRRTLDQLEQNVQLSVEQSYISREQARRQIVSAQTAVQASQLNYNVALEKQRNGLINVLEVITAEAQLVTAQVNLVVALYDFYIADAALRRDTGLNDPQYLPKVPGVKPPSAVPVPTSSRLISSPVALNAPAVPASGANASPPGSDAGGRKQ